MTSRTALVALRRALGSGSVRLAPHTIEKMAAFGVSAAVLRAELALASAAGDVHVNRNHPGRFVALGEHYCIAFEVVAPDVIVITFFDLE